MTPGVDPIASWLLEVYLLATAVLGVAGLAMLGLSQPARRLAVARAAVVALAWLAPLVAACRWGRASTLPHKHDNMSAYSDLCSRISCAGPTAAAAVPDARPGAILGAFASGSGLAIGWLVLGAIAGARLRRRSRPAPERLRAILARVVGQGGRMPRLLVCPSAAQPFAFGLIRPTIVVPTRFADAETAGGIEAALAHEWAHLRNGDLRFLALSRLLLPLLFAHPLYAWLRRRVRADQEMLADAEAARGEGRIAYAEALLGWARSGEAGAGDRFAPILGLWDRPSALRRRLALLLDRDFRVEPACPRRWRLAACAVAVAGLAAVAVASPAVEPFARVSRCPQCDPQAGPAVTVLACPDDRPVMTAFVCPREPAASL